ncbi:MAG TPA: phosphoglycerate mutase family protein [Acidimicrobiia bacterium]|nr:phosphoglycerate mutase family protein [Acidimicrobiia bacterium]
MIHLVRHAHAGVRAHWTGPDDRRPLTDRGRLQAKRIAERLAVAGDGVVIASPYIRCMQTLEPLAERLGSRVVPEPLLAEGAAPEPVARLIARLPVGSVLCSHGDVIANLVGHLSAEGAAIDATIDTQKGGTWTFEVSEGRVRAGVYTPPPAE